MTLSTKIEVLQILNLFAVGLRTCTAVACLIIYLALTVCLSVGLRVILVRYGCWLLPEP